MRDSRKYLGLTIFSPICWCASTSLGPPSLLHSRSTTTWLSSPSFLLLGCCFHLIIIIIMGPTLERQADGREIVCVVAAVYIRTTSNTKKVPVPTIIILLHHPCCYIVRRSVPYRSFHKHVSHQACGSRPKPSAQQQQIHLYYSSCSPSSLFYSFCRTTPPLLM